MSGASTTITAPVRRRRGGLQLLLVDDAAVRSYPLPRRGALVVGRSTTADLQLDHPEVSRRHFELSIGWRLHVEDLGSRNGIAVGGARLPAGKRVAIAIGQPLELGAVTVIVDRARAPAERGAIIVDAVVHEVRRGEIRVALARRPVVRRLIYELAAAGGACAKAALVGAVCNLAYHPLRHDNVLRVTVHQARGLLAPLGLAIEFLPDTGYGLVVPRGDELRLRR